MKIQSVLIVLFACLGLVTSQAAYYCGRTLSLALDEACSGNLIKRSEPRQASALESRWPWIDASRARGLGFRAKRGVVDECCFKPCTVDELMTYCH